MTQPPPIVPGAVYQSRPVPVVPPAAAQPLRQTPGPGLSQGAIAAIVVGIVGGLSVLAVAVSLIAPKSPATTPTGPAPADVTIESCSMSSARFAKADLRIENHTKAIRDYFITVVFEDAGVQVGSGVATVLDLSPGQVARDTAIGSVNNTNITQCRVTSVRRS